MDRCIARAFWVILVVKSPPASAGDVRDAGSIPGLEREEGMAAHSSILAWEIHGQRSLSGYSPCSHKESNTTKETSRARAGALQCLYWCIVPARGLCPLATALSVQHCSDGLPAEKEFRKVQGHANWIYLLISYINLCRQMSWTAVELKGLAKGREGGYVQNQSKNPTLDICGSIYVTDFHILCKIQMSPWIKMKLSSSRFFYKN